MTIYGNGGGFEDPNRPGEDYAYMTWKSAKGGESLIKDMPPMYRGNALRLLVRTFGVGVLKAPTAKAIMYFGYEVPFEGDLDDTDFDDE